MITKISLLCSFLIDLDIFLLLGSMDGVSLAFRLLTSRENDGYSYIYNFISKYKYHILDKYVQI